MAEAPKGGFRSSDWLKLDLSQKYKPVKATVEIK